VPGDETLPWNEPSDITRALLALLELRGVGVGALRRLSLNLKLDGPKLKWSDSFVSPDVGIRQASESESDLARREASELVKECAALRVNVLSFADPEYPAILREIADFPPIIYVKGNVEALNSCACVAVVGTRNSSPVGEEWARKIAKTLAQQSVTVISGLALGIDTCAHEGALEGGGITVAILAHGLDIVAPARNRGLAARILENNGALVSEHRPGTPPRPPEFVRRNRIQSGMSLASIVVESAAEGGAIHQANFTRQQGRMLYVALPPQSLQDVHGFNDEGSRYLIEHKNARTLSSQDELLVEIKRFKLECSANKSKADAESAPPPMDEAPSQMPLIQ
jgi:DNA processing protein